MNALDSETLRNHLTRVVVIGESGSGKTRFARRLAEMLKLPAVELDALYWGPSWTPVAAEEFLRRANAAANAERWIIDGNYSATREIVWPRATAIVWLNYPLATVFVRLLGRTIRRAATGETLFAGNRESVRLSFFSTDSIMVWMLKTFRRRRRTYRELHSTVQYPQLQWFEFRTPGEAENFLRRLASECGREMTPAQLTSPAPTESEVAGR